jgi:soluble lytic murein transglycosylase-like protein
MNRRHESIIKQTIIGLAVVGFVFTALVGLAGAMVEQIPLNNNRDKVNIPLLLEEAKQDSHKVAEQNVKEVQEFQQVLAAIRKTKSKLNPHEEWELARVVIDQGRNFGLDPMLALSIIRIESNFNPNAVSPVNAIGLMQVLPSTARALAYELEEKWGGADSLFDISTNVRLGLYYFRKLETHYKGNRKVALAAYNFGPTYVDRMIKEGGHVPRKYAAKVINMYNKKFGGNV